MGAALFPVTSASAVGGGAIGVGVAECLWAEEQWLVATLSRELRAATGGGALQADLSSYVDEVATRRLAALEQQQEDREREEEYYANLNLYDEDRY